MVGRPRKQTNVKQRTVYVYVPNKGTGDEWKKAAKKAGVSLSTYVQEAMDFYLARNNPNISRDTLQQRYEKSLNRIEKLEEETEQLHRKLQRDETLLDRYEKQLREMENSSFMSHEQFNGIRRYNKRLIELFKHEVYLDEEKILDKLNIPPGDRMSIQAIGEQIENLLQYGVIKPKRGGYEWCG